MKPVHHNKSFTSNGRQDPLEKYIHEHRQAFDEEPAADHFERFQQKIDRRKRMSVSFRRRSIGMAASLLLLLSIGVLLPHFNKPAEKIVVVCENTETMKQCYLSKMNDVVFQIDKMTKGLNLEEWEQEAVMSEVETLLLSNEYFEQEIPEELPDEAAKEILSDYYRHNLESLQTIAQSLEEKK